MESYLKARRAVGGRPGEDGCLINKDDDNKRDHHQSWRSLLWKAQSKKSFVFLICFLVVILSQAVVIIVTLNFYEYHYHGHKECPTDTVLKERLLQNTNHPSQPIVWIKGKNLETGYLKHVFAVFERLGYEIHTNEPSHTWDILWSHNYPFNEMKGLKNLKPFQKVNHFPGSGFITNKLSLATSALKHVPPAFQIPKDRERLLQYAQEHPAKMWVQKSNSHRGIRVEKIADLDLETNGTFVQEYIQNPYLVDGRKFDIGIYTVLTSVNPLRVYTYEGDVLLRFCIKEYYPFDAADLETYVVGDDYLPVWKVPSLKPYFQYLGFTAKESLNAHIAKQGKDPSKIWQQIREAIATVYYAKEKSLMGLLTSYKSKRNFFELVRFDFVLDENLAVYLMEANMSPNLSSAHFSENKLLYEQVIFNTLSLIGIAKSVKSTSLHELKDDEYSMQVSLHDIQVFPETCISSQCQSCISKKCSLCLKCLSADAASVLRDAYAEHMDRRGYQRVIPPPIKRHPCKRCYLERDISGNLCLEIANWVLTG